MGKGDGDDSDSGDENRPPRTHRRQLSLQDLRDAAAAADYPQSPPPTNDVGISLLGRLGSPRRLVNSPNRSPPPEDDTEAAAQAVNTAMSDDDVLHLVEKDQAQQKKQSSVKILFRNLIEDRLP